MNQNLLEKYRNLQAYLLELEEVVIAYTGGIESSLLLKIAYDTLKHETLALMAKFDAMSEKDYEYALISARETGVYPITLKIDSKNTNKVDCLRTDHNCLNEKKMLVTFNQFVETNQLLHLLVAKPFRVNSVCENDKLCNNPRVLKPFEVFEFTLEDIQVLAKELGVNSIANYLSNYKSDSNPGDDSGTSELILKKQQAEEFLRNLNFRSVRVKMENNVLYLTVDPSQLQLIYDHDVRKNIISFMKNLGFKNVSINATERALL